MHRMHKKKEKRLILSSLIAVLVPGHFFRVFSLFLYILWLFVFASTRTWVEQNRKRFLSPLISFFFSQRQGDGAQTRRRIKKKKRLSKKKRNEDAKKEST
nr:hypothetical protein [Pandoravirus aubagnensis]